MTESAVSLKPSAYRGEEPFAFVSSAHADSKPALAEIDALSRRGFNLYFDDDIEPGSRWHDELAQAIVCCELFVLMVTSHSIDSPHCQREIAFAIEENKPILAVHLEDVELPAGIRLIWIQTVPASSVSATEPTSWCRSCWP